MKSYFLKKYGVSISVDSWKLKPFGLRFLMNGLRIRHLRSKAFLSVKSSFISVNPFNKRLVSFCAKYTEIHPASTGFDDFKCDEFWAGLYGRNIELKGDIGLPYVGQWKFAGKFNLRLGLAEVKLKNAESFIFRNYLGYVIDPFGMDICVLLDSKKCLRGQFKIDTRKKHPKAKKVYPIRGNFCCGSSMACVRANSNFYRFTMGFNLKSRKIERLRVFNLVGKELASVEQDESGKIKALCEIKPLTQILDRSLFWSFNVHEGLLWGEINNARERGRASGKVGLKRASILFKGQCNPIKSALADFSINLNEHSAVFENIDFTFLKGHIGADKILCSWSADDNYYKIHAPVKLDNFTFNYKNKFHSITSGNLSFLVETGKSPSLCGDLILHRSRYKDFEMDAGIRPPFLEIHRALKRGEGLKVDLKVKSQQPMEIEHKFFRGEAQLNFLAKSFYANGDLHNTRIDGKIKLTHGNMRILKNRFRLVSGELIFAPHRSDDPLINFCVKGRLKKYNVILSATGSKKNPFFSFSSYPELREEQIISLLLSGSENIPLSQGLPGMILNHMEEIVPKNEGGAGGFEKLVKRISRPFNRLKIVPYFSSNKLQEVGASVDLQVAPGLHASLKKGIKNSDDLDVQMEYFLTNNLSFKIARRNHGDIGGELEMRVKF
ncbi:translocation/assembly module TamB domain-containing protein [Candidatus Dependentiae bacterium]